MLKNCLYIPVCRTAPATPAVSTMLDKFCVQSVSFPYLLGEAMTSCSTSFSTAASCHNIAKGTDSLATVNSDPKINTWAVINLPGYSDQGLSDNVKSAQNKQK